MFKRAVVAAVFCSTASLSYAQDIQDIWKAPEMIKFSAYVTDMTNTLTGNKQLNINGDWKQNSEVAAYKKLKPLQRAAGLFAFTKLQDDYDKLVFPAFDTSAEQEKVANFIRRDAYVKYMDLFGDSIQDAIAKEYLIGEIAELNEVIAGNVSMEKFREDSNLRHERVAILLNSAAFFTEMIKLQDGTKGNGKKVTTLAQKTYMISLLHVCLYDVKYCLKAAGR